MSTINQWFVRVKIMFAVVSFLVCVFFNNAIAGPSGASLSPTRVVIPATQNSASVTLTNTSDREVAYRMSMIEMGLDDSGRFRRLADDELHPGHRSAKSIVRFSPRQVRLQPGASEVVRVIARRGRMTAGEYRSHMLLSALPVLAELDSGGISNPVLIESSSTSTVGVSIPVIVRHRETQASIDLKQSSIYFNQSGTGGRVNLLLGLQGNRSAYGDFSVSLVNGKREKIIAKLKGFALYYPYPQENVLIRLRNDVKRDEFTADSRLRVRFKNKAIDSNKAYRLDDLTLPEIVR